jgi:hypothetical protein
LYRPGSKTLILSSSLHQSLELYRDKVLPMYRTLGKALSAEWKIDFIFLKPRAFSQEEFMRRVEADGLGMRLFVATPEDLLIAKLEWAKLGESDRQVRDAAGMIATQGGDLDMTYVEGWVERLGLGAQ